MKSLKLLFLAATICSIFYSCGSDGSDDPAPTPSTPTVSSNLTGNTWTMDQFATIDIITTAVGAPIGQSSRTDTTTLDFPTSLPCRGDDNMTFNENGTFSINDAGTACDPSQVESTGVAASGTWSLNSAETQLTLDINNASNFFITNGPFGTTGNRALFTPGFDFAYEIEEPMVMSLISGDAESNTLSFEFVTTDTGTDNLGGAPITQTVRFVINLSR